MNAAERLKELRERAGFDSATAAARAHGWNVNTYRSHENGVRGVRLAEMQSYAKAFGCDPAWLAMGEGSPPSQVEAASEGKDHRVPVMMTAAEVIAIDDWGFANRVRSRSEAIRRLCSLALAGSKMGEEA